jgi:hypothetical protein
MDAEAAQREKNPGPAAGTPAAERVVKCKHVKNAAREQSGNSNTRWRRREDDGEDGQYGYPREQRGASQVPVEVIADCHGWG